MRPGKTEPTFVEPGRTGITNRPAPGVKAFGAGSTLAELRCRARAFVEESVGSFHCAQPTEKEITATISKVVKNFSWLSKRPR